jgi:uncharacterized protein (DUF1015 family)
MSEIITQTLANILIAVITLVGAYIIFILTKYTEKLKAETQKIKDEHQRALINQAIDNVDKLIKSTVVQAQETTVIKIKEAIADGKIDKTELAKVAIDVKDKVISQLSLESINLAKQEITDIETYILTRVENELAVLKGRA